MAARKRFLLRVDPAVYEALERWAGDELRSVNAQIEFLLRDALRRAGRLKRDGTEGSEPGGEADREGQQGKRE